MLAIARDLQWLAADLDRICQGDEAILSVALEDAHYALTRAAAAAREVLVATVAAVAPREIAFEQHLPPPTSGKVMRRR